MSSEWRKTNHGMNWSIATERCAYTAIVQPEILSDILFQTEQAQLAFETVFSKSQEKLECKSDFPSLFQNIQGL